MNKFKTNILIILLTMLILQDVLQQYFIILKYLDEFVAYVLGMIAIFILLTSKKKLLTKYEKKILIIIILFMIIGIFMQLISNIQEPKYAFIDFLLFFKSIFAYLTIRILFKDIDYEKCKKKLNKYVKVFTILVFAVYLLNYVFKFYPLVETRYGIKVYEIMFSHVTFLVAFAVCNIAILKINMNNSTNKYIVMNLGLILFTLRSKAILFLVVYLYVFIVRKKKKISFIEIIMAMISMSIVFYSTFKEKMVDGYARSILTKYSFIIAKDYFPFGSGFGTFASDISGKYYSKIYYNYSINNTYGLSEGNTSFVSDTFWPMVLGETGVLGLVMFISIIFMLTINVFKLKIDINKKYTILIPITYLLISSLGESAFANFFGVSLMSIMALNINRAISECKTIKYDGASKIS